MTTAAAAYDCIIFYRWYTRDGKQARGRTMARLVTDALEALGMRVWLDQRQMSMDATREEVLEGVYNAFLCARYVIILAAPGDWDRFVNDNDIHRWEWEISLKSSEYPDAKDVMAVGTDNDSKTNQSGCFSMKPARERVHIRPTLCLKCVYIATWSPTSHFNGVLKCGV